MSDKVVPTIITLVILVIVFGGMVLAWRRRRRASASLERPMLGADEIGEELTDVEAFYVATTPLQKPLERLAITGLEFRARARIRVFRNAVVLELPGESPTMIPATALDAVGLSNVTIDRVVENDGLVVVTWRLSDAAHVETAVDSYLRIVDAALRAATVEAIASIIPVPTASAPNTHAERKV